MVTVVARRLIPAGREAKVRSRPGHLIHLMERGHYRVITNGREYHMRPGDMIYYHDGEDVATSTRVEVQFLTVGFYAPEILPPPVENRKFRSTPRLRRLYLQAYRASLMPEGLRRDSLVSARVLEVLAGLPWELGRPGKVDPACRLWWDIEGWIRRGKLYRVSMAEIEARWLRSRSTVTRSCRKATGLSPLRRVASLRMEEARGMLQFSKLSVGEVAARLGYPRMHEFSREFSRHYGRPPSRWARSGED
jgi:AraC-like DNA-binding protein